MCTYVCIVVVEERDEVAGSTQAGERIMNLRNV